MKQFSDVAREILNELASEYGDETVRGKCG
jgi:hypothetical protein